MQNVVVLADDESLVRMFLAEELTEQGYDVIEAATGEEALALLQKVQAACLVTDIEMGTPLDGIRLARITNERWPDLAVVVMSGRRQAPDLAENAVFLAKPFKASHLIDVIDELLVDVGSAPDRNAVPLTDICITPGRAELGAAGGLAGPLRGPEE